MIPPRPALALLVTIAVMGTGCAHMPPDRTSFTELDRRAVAAAVDELVDSFADSATVCLQLFGQSGDPSPPPPSLLSLLRVAPRVVLERDCPPTYDRMIALVDSLGQPIDAPRPPGYVDPHRLLVGRPQFDGPRYGFVYARALQGTRGSEYVCTVSLQSFLPEAHCERTRRWIH